MIGTAPNAVTLTKQPEIFARRIHRSEGGELCAGVNPSYNPSCGLVPEMALLGVAIEGACYQSQLSIQRERNGEVGVVQALARVKVVNPVDLLVAGLPWQCCHPAERRVGSNELASIGVRDCQRPYVVLPRVGYKRV